MLQPGTQVGGYLIESVLGHGGMSVVYEARQLALDRKVALKLLAPHLAADADFRERFRHEGRLQATLDHPHIVTVYEAGELREGLYLAMRLIRGATLKDMVIARELDGERTIRLLEPIADALDTAHEAGLIHRDVKPQNILVDRRDHSYLADFGLMKGAGSKGMTRTGTVVGTVDYIAPEQIRGEEATGASDIYSFTALLYETFAGDIPYVRGADAAVMYAHLTDPPPRVTDLRPDLPSALDEVIARGMAKYPGERYESASDVIREAHAALGSQVRVIITPSEPLAPPRRGNGAAHVSVPEPAEPRAAHAGGRDGGRDDRLPTGRDLRLHARRDRGVPAAGDGRDRRGACRLRARRDSRAAARRDGRVRPGRGSRAVAAARRSSARPERPWSPSPPRPRAARRDDRRPRPERP